MSASFPVTDDTRWRISTAVAGQTAFSVPFPFQERGDVVVWKQSVGGLISVLTLDVHYTIVGAGNPAGGTVTLTAGAAAGEKIYRIGQATLDRLTSVVRNGKFSSEALDEDLDRTVITLQEFRRDVSRAWVVAFGQTAGSITVGRPGYVPIFDVNGNLVEGPSLQDVGSVAEISDAVVQVAAIRADVSAVALGIAAVTVAANNMPAINAAPTQAANAAASATLAQKWANEPEDSIVMAGLYSAFHWSRKATASALAAAASAANAAAAVLSTILGWATKSTPSDADLFGFVQASDSTGRKLTWAAIKSALAGLFPRFDTASVLTAAQRQRLAANIGMGYELVGFQRLGAQSADMKFFANLGDYVSLRIEGRIIPVTGGGSPIFRFSSDGSTFPTTNTYFMEYNYAAGGGSAQNTSSLSYGGLASVGVPAGFFDTFQLLIFEWNTAAVAQWLYSATWNNGAGSMVLDNGSGQVTPAAAYNGIQFASNVGQLAAGSWVAIFGRKE